MQLDSSSEWRPDVGIDVELIAVKFDVVLDEFEVMRDAAMGVVAELLAHGTLRDGDIPHEALMLDFADTTFR